MPMTVEFGFDDTTLGLIESDGSTVELTPAEEGAEPVLEEIFDHYAQAILLDGSTEAAVTPDAVLQRAVASMKGRSWAKKVDNEPTENAAKKKQGGNCGVGPGGFQPGNTCAKGGGMDAATKTGYSLRKLDEAADEAGHALFDSHRSGYVSDPATMIEHVKLSDLLKPDEESDEPHHATDEYEHLFYPSTGKGLDVASGDWGDAHEGWADKDGLIYTKWQDIIRVVVPDVPLQTAAEARKKSKQRAADHRKKADEQKKALTPDPSKPVGKFHYGQHVVVKTAVGPKQGQVDRYFGDDEYGVKGDGWSGLYKIGKIKVKK